jgi:hypothetical protein
MKRLLTNLFGGKRLHSENKARRTFVKVEELESCALMAGLTIVPVPLNLPGPFSDGGFTTPALAANAYQYDPTGTPWLYTGKAGVSTCGSGFTAGNPAAPGGAQVAFLQQTGSMRQTFSLAPGSYSLVFESAQRANDQTHFQAFNVLVDGKLADVVIPPGTGYTVHRTPNFTVAGSSHTLEFQGIDPLGGDNTAFVAAIQIGAPVSTGNSVPPLLAEALADGRITYDRMMGLFGNVEADGVLTIAELQGLQTIAADATAFNMPADIADLAGKLIDGDPANGAYRYLGSDGCVKTIALGNLQCGSSIEQLKELVDKWFRGVDYPAANPAQSYSPASGSLFNPATNVPSYSDVQQTGLGDCWLMSSFEEAARQTPAIVSAMFTYEGVTTEHNATVGLWSVRFYQNGAPTYVMVNNELPDGGFGDYDHPANGALWAALAEKAYAQLHSHSYLALNGGSSQGPLAEITGRGAFERSFYTSNGEVIATSATSISINSIFDSSNEITSIDDMAAKVNDAFHGGQLVTFGTNASPSDPLLAPKHLYALLAIDDHGNYLLGNPWGPDGGTDADNGKFYPGAPNVDKNDLFNSCDYLAFTTGTSPADSTSNANSTRGVSPRGTLDLVPAAAVASSTAPATLQATAAKAALRVQSSSVSATSDLLTHETASFTAHRKADARKGGPMAAHLDAGFAKDLDFFDVG